MFTRWVWRCYWSRWILLFVACFLMARSRYCSIPMGAGVAGRYFIDSTGMSASSEEDTQKNHIYRGGLWMFMKDMSLSCNIQVDTSTRHPKAIMLTNPLFFMSLQQNSWSEGRSFFSERGLDSTSLAGSPRWSWAGFYASNQSWVMVKCVMSTDINDLVWL